MSRLEQAGSMRGIQFILSFTQLSIVFKTIRPFRDGSIEAHFQSHLTLKSSIINT